MAWQSDDSIAAASIVGGTVIPFNKMIDAADPEASPEQPTVLQPMGVLARRRFLTMLANLSPYDADAASERDEASMYRNPS